MPVRNRISPISRKNGIGARLKFAIADIDPGDERDNAGAAAEEDESADDIGQEERKSDRQPEQSSSTQIEANHQG